MRGAVIGAHGLRAGLVLRIMALAVALAGTTSGCTQDVDSAPAKKSEGRSLHLVEVERALRQPLRLSQVHTGSLRARRLVRIHTQEAGRITALTRFEGDRVEAGEVLLTLDDTLLATELAKAKAVRQDAQANLRRLTRLEKSRMVAEEEVERARTAVDVALAEEALLTTRLGYTRVAAPFAGVVSERLAEPGDIAERFDHVMTVIDPDSLVADLQVSELLLPHIDSGTRVEVRIDALGDRPLAGHVIRVHPELDPATRQGRVEIALDPTPSGARAGQFARVSFELQALERLVIPFAGLRRDEGGEYVFRLNDDDTVNRVRVRAGQRLADRVEILEGLDDGDRVVRRGFLGLNPGMQVKTVGGASG